MGTRFIFISQLRKYVVELASVTIIETILQASYSYSTMVS